MVATIMPTDTSSKVAVSPKVWPASVSPSRHVLYVFPEEHAAESSSSEAVFRFPFSETVYWFNVRCTVFTSAGIMKTEKRAVELYYRCADGTNVMMIGPLWTSPHRWYSLRWPTPSFFSSVAVSGLYLHVARKMGEDVRVELQGVDSWLPIQEKYITMTDELRSFCLFHRKEQTISLLLEDMASDVRPHEDHDVLDVAEERERLAEIGDRVVKIFPLSFLLV